MKKSLTFKQLSITLKKAFNEAIAAGNPDKVLSLKLNYLLKNDFNPNFILSLGKAATSMAETIRKFDINAPGIIVTNDQNYREVKGFKCFASGHPIPDKRGVTASKEVEKKLKTLSKNDHLLLLLSGGGSALLPAPSDGISLNQKIYINQKLLSSGFDIHKINAARRLFSRLKGGRLAALLNSAKITQLILSDVPGDNLESICSGLAAPETFELKEVISILEKSDLMKENFIKKSLKKIEDGEASKPLRKNNAVFKNVESHILASNKICQEAISKYLSEILDPFPIKPPELANEAKLMGLKLAQWCIKNKPNKPSFFVTGGETTVTLKNSEIGLGGRSQELAISFAIEMKKYKQTFKRSWAICSAGTDGRDGPTDAAGAIITSKNNINITEAQKILKKHDSYTFLKKLNLIINSKGTDTNLGDVVIIIIF